MARPGDAARWRAPGRINLIGEHTDYNDGFALPFALDACCTASAAVGDGSAVSVRSAQRDAEVVVDLDRLAPGVGGWAGYVLGVAWALGRHGHRVPGLRIEVDSRVPVGSGLSSSAALVCATATALNELMGLGLDDAQLLALTREVENDFVGAPTGGMDQLASLRCVPDHALFCDMRTLRTEQVPLPLGASGPLVVVIDTRAEHRHADGEYGARRAGCREAASILGVAALRDIGLDGLPVALARLGAVDALRRYTRHVVTENDRVLRAVNLLRAGRIAELGPLLDESHASMRDDYRITVPEVDVAAESLVEAGALGARMTGGGFGGCVIGLISPDAVAAAVSHVQRRFTEHGFRAPGHFVVEHAAAGAHRADREPAR